MKLYYKRSACSLAVRIVINELNLSSEYESVDLAKKVTETGESFLEINPKGVVPVVVTDHGVLTENSVILQYLVDHAKASHLLPGIEDFNRYRVLEWLNYVATEMHKGCSPFFMEGVPDEVLQDRFVPLMKRKLDYLNKTLEQHRYLLGESAMLPDFYLFVVLRWLPSLKFSLDDWPHVARYFKDMGARSSVMKSLQEEKL